MRRLICLLTFALVSVLAGAVHAQSSLRLTSYEDTPPPYSESTGPAAAQPVQPYMPIQPFTPPPARAVQPRRMPNYFAPRTPASTAAPAATTATTAPQSRPLPRQAQNVIGYFGNERAAETLRRMPQRPPISRQPISLVSPRQQQMLRTQNKPFSNASNGPTVSPYLNLYREEDFDSAPNYYAFVRPQQEQIETNERQRAELMRLQRQVQRMSYDAPAAGTTPVGAPGTGHRARFGDTAQFYSGFAR